MITLLVTSNDSTLQTVSDIFKSFMNLWYVPVMTTVGVLGLVFGVVGAVKFWRAGGDEQKHKEAKNFLIGILIGFAVLFLLVAAVPPLVGALSGWADTQG